MLGVLAILLSLFALMYFAYKGVSVLILAPVLAVLAALLSGELPPLYALSNIFMPAAAGYINSYYPVFLAGAVFGKLMGVTGAATSTTPRTRGSPRRRPGRWGPPGPDPLEPAKRGGPEPDSGSGPPRSCLLRACGPCPARKLRASRRARRP